MVLMSMNPMQLFADGYDRLWRQGEEYGERDLPKSSMEVLQKIIAKAEQEKRYGHLLKAQLMNASLMVEDMGCCAICFDGLVDTGDESPLCFRPLEPGITVYGSVIWKRYQPLSPAARIFMDRLRDALKKMNTHE